jgi:ATP-dependent helicase YprA (DUF1998 family)
MLIPHDSLLFRIDDLLSNKQVIDSHSCSPSISKSTVPHYPCINGRLCVIQAKATTILDALTTTMERR